MDGLHKLRARIEAGERLVRERVAAGDLDPNEATRQLLSLSKRLREAERALQAAEEAGDRVR